MRRPSFGSIYRRKKKLPDGSVIVMQPWWIKYRKDGQVYRESSESEIYEDAERLLKRRQGEIVTGKFSGMTPERVRLKELFADVVEDYRISDRESIKDVEGRVENHLQPAFGHLRAAQFTTQHVKRYIAERQKEEAKNATINRELAILRRAFKLAATCDPPKVVHVPHIKLLKENNVRTGFLEHDQYLKLRDELPWYIRPLYVVAYHVGGRRGELSCIKWPQVDFAANQIRLNPGETKNDAPRTLPIYDEMRHWLTLAKEIRDQKFPDCPWVFYDADGERLYWFYKEWKDACTRAKLPGLLFHDLRRSAVRNMERGGVSRKVATAISGHKTEAIYRRYDIVAHRDLTDAAARMEQYFENVRHKGTLPGTPEQKESISECPANESKMLN